MDTSEETEDAVDRTGTVIDDRFAVEQLLARGGFGAVYRARRVFDGATVAIKVLELTDDVEANAIERFTREAEVVRGLESPHTVRIYETGQVGTEFLYTVMEYIPGRSLLSQLRKGGALNSRQVAEVAIQLCDALLEVHDQGYLHRDLKPSNIMLFRNDEGRVIVKLLDFGVAKIVDPPDGDTIQLTAAGAFIGTPRYASPEQMRREPLSPASDVYALGLIMYEALLGQPAIKSVEYGACVRAHISAEPWTLPDSSRYPPEFAQIVEKALRKPVAERYQTCAELREALDDFLTHRVGGASG